MPDITGIEFLRRVRRDHPDAIRLLFTGYADIKAVIDAINEGHVYRYITKPWDPDELLSVLRQACTAHDHLAGHQRLLTELRAYLVTCVPVLKGLSQHEHTIALAAIGTELLTRLERALSGQDS